MARRNYIFIRSIMGLGFHMMFMVSAIYRIDIAHLEFYQLILIGTALEIAVFLFETPTGVVADLKSRKLSVIMGLFIIGFGFIIEALTPFFWIIFLSQIIWGLGYTFISGALDSWVSDETKNEEIEQTLITSAQYNKLFSVLGMVLAGVIGMFSITVSIYVSGGLFITLGFISIIIMKENNFVKHSYEESILKSYITHLTKGFKHIKTNKTLRVMFVIMLFFGLYSEGIDRTHERFILDNLNMRYYFDIAPVWILSIINIIVAISGFVLLHVVKKCISKSHHTILWAFNFTIMMIVGILLFAFLPYEYLAVMGYIFFSISREGTYPLLNTILLKNIPSEIKATVLSSFGQLDAIGQLMSGALMVGVSILVGIQGMYVFTAILLCVPILLFLSLKEEKQPKL